MSGKIRHLENNCANTSLRNRGKDFPYKKQKCDRQTDRHTDRHSCLEKALLALKMPQKTVAIQRLFATFSHGFGHIPESGKRGGF